MIYTLAYFVLALALLIVVHEFGHYIVARAFGVKVLRFSFGFGKVLASWHDKHGTEFAWSVFPLGGYVKMLDESEGDVPESEKPLAFNNQSVWVRIAIIVAGPFFNFLFALVALWLVLVIGIKSLAPIIDAVEPGSLADQAGLKPKHEILELNGKRIDSWRAFQYSLMPLIGSKKRLEITLKSLSDGSISGAILPFENWTLNVKDPDVLKSLGIVPFVPTIPPIVGEVVEGTPAQKAGLKTGDVITHIDKNAVKDWLALLDYVQKHPDQRVKLIVKREGRTRTLEVVIGHLVNDKGQLQGFLGVRSQKPDWPANWLRMQRQHPIQAIPTAFKQTVEMTGATFTLIGRLIMGDLPLQSLSGPVGIAQGAGESARSGVSYYLFFLALVSISLGVLNLLPIPILDGGHLLFCILEMIRRRPLSESTKSVWIYLGLIFLIGLTILALSNDLTRIFKL